LEPDSPQPNPSQAEPQSVDPLPPDPQPSAAARVDRAPGGQEAGGEREGDDAAAANGQAGFLAATLAELRRVVWPSRQQLFSESVAVILMVSLSAAAIAAIDRFYGWASTQVFR
jgi:preprotein translocase subunit SecE